MIPVAEMAPWRDGATLVAETRKSLPLVSLSLVFRGGTTQDPAGKEGLAALTARLLERGTKKRTRARIADEIESMGGSFAAHATRESIRLDAAVLSRSLDSLLDVLADVLLESAFAEDELEQAKDEMLAELALAREEDRDLGDQLFRHTIYEGAHGRFAGGTEVSIPSLTRADVVERWRNGIVTGALIAGAAGDIDLDALGKRLERHLPSLAKRVPLAPPAPIARTIRGVEALLVDKPERTQTQIFLGHTMFGHTDPAFLPFLVANHAFGGMFTSRLMQEVRVKRGWSYGAHSRLELLRGQSLTGVWTFPSNDDTIACVRLLLDLIREFAAKGVSVAELDAAKGHLLNTLAFEVETPEQRVQRRIHEILLDLPADWTQTFVDGVERVSLDQANGAAARAVRQDMALVLVCTAETFVEKLRELPEIRAVDVVPFDAEDPAAARSWRWER